MKKNKKIALGVTAGIIAAYAAYQLFFKKFDSSKFKGKKILFVGDSHTVGLSNWVGYLANKYGFTPVNTAEGGKSTAYMLSKLKTTLANSKDYYACFIYGGANDAYSSVTNEKAVDNIQQMVDLCNQNGIIPIVIIGYNTMKVSVGNEALKTTKYVTTQQGMWDLAKKRYLQQLLMRWKIKKAYIVPMWNDVSHDTAKLDGLHIYINLKYE